MFPKYDLNEKQIKGIANIVLHEQGTVAGYYAEASQIANRTDIKGNEYATGKRAVDTVTSRWYAKGELRYLAGTSDEKVIRIVKNVFCKGMRTLPRYIDEHDCMSDIKSVHNGTRSVKSDKSKWVRHQSVIRNRRDSTYIFYDFPGGYKTGVDPFGYIKKSNREKYGDFCIPYDRVEDILKKKTLYDIVKVAKFPERGYFKKGDKYKSLEDIQIGLGLIGYYKGAVDGIYGDKTKDAVKKLQMMFDLDVNGCFGNKCLEASKSIKL